MFLVNCLGTLSNCIHTFNRDLKTLNINELKDQIAEAFKKIAEKAT